MRPLKLNIAVAAAVIVVSAIWFAENAQKKRARSEEATRDYRHIECQHRNEAFDKRIAAIKQDAHEQLKVGAKKADVTRFFATHGIPFEVAGSEATGTLYTIGGCAPLGCGTDRALIGVRVKVDAEMRTEPSQANRS